MHAILSLSNKEFFMNIQRIGYNACNQLTKMPPFKDTVYINRDSIKKIDKVTTPHNYYGQKEQTAALFRNIKL